MKKLSQSKQDKLQEFVDFLRKTNADEAEDPTGPLPSSSAGGSSSNLEVPLSQVSQDEFGLPKVPCSDASSDLDMGTPLPISKQEIRTKKAALAAGAEAATDNEQVCKRPGSKIRRPAASGGKAKGKPQSKASSLKRPAAKEEETAGVNENTESKDSGRKENEVQLFTTFGTDQSYICAKEDNKRKLWVAVSKRQSNNHADLIRKIFLERPKSKAEALKLRQKHLDAENEG